ncbi:ChbG/HpnK family deacetylase [Streptacidiphilus sp. PB12-B1b]|uniref:carbohydrate deacetylase n=1 Tax=Streptacidiphilus sp. PB12-B1b TaxID=2705012 RepID=UPI0015F96F38|nr:ChbG/HpnK family deacetylase [Streptacidiphilus sp. PB12-B1b]QMU78215.1 ChbG/HpnK family deacetylase [Streptacidiphilus sp. PB12-B1b]
MTERTERILVVQADDYGMCPAVTDGILAAHRAGAVTQASVMVPAPDAHRAMWLARRRGLVLGAHLVLACEWEGLRYHPLTPAGTLRAPDGGYLPGIAELRAAGADPGEALVELREQLRVMEAAGIRPRHCESHVGVFDPDVLAAVSAERGLPCRDDVPAPGVPMALDSLWHLSTRPLESKTDDLLAHLAALPPGTHMVVAHPAADRPELDTLTDPGSRRWKWARPIRVSDLATLLDPRFHEAVTRLGITLAPLPAKGNLPQCP